MSFFAKKQKTAAKEVKDYAPAAFCARQQKSFFRTAVKGSVFERELYDEVRNKIPVVDAAIGKIIRLTGSFRVSCEDKALDRGLERFVNNLPVGLTGVSLASFLESYLDSLLTYGKAAGEILFDESGEILGLVNADAADIHVKAGASPVDRQFYVYKNGREIRAKYPERILFTALNPSPQYPEGVSLLRGVPTLSNILEEIYTCIGKNFERAGNLRYAVTYKPQSESDISRSKERAEIIAKEWADGMQSLANGVVKDFVAVGDVEIKVIGAESPLLDTQIPVRQLLEQVLSKLSIPPFLLGLNWSSTERMSAQQVDILTSELEYYRRLLNPVIRRVCLMYLERYGYDGDLSIEWDNINLQDESELAKARLYNAQAHALEIENALKEEKIIE